MKTPYLLLTATQCLSFFAFVQTAGSQTDREQSTEVIRKVTYVGPDIDISPTSLTIYQSSTASSGPAFPHRGPSRWLNPLPARPPAPGSENMHGLGGIIPKDVGDYWNTHESLFHYDGSPLPPSIDWSGNDSPVRDQGLCGSCWAFGSIAYMENVTGIPDLSEQVLVSCVGNCNGGSHLDALNYFHNVGVPEESCYPYLATNGNCDDRCASPVFLERVTSANLLWGQQCTAENLKAALQTGPLVVMMKVFTDFDSYPGGVYNYTSGNYRGLHVVNLVGYNDTLECFKAKNSWGPDWGEGGYFRIGYANVSNAVLFGQYAMNVSGPYTQYLIGAAFTIRNLGDDDLSVRRITTDRGWLLYSPAVPPNANLRPGGTRDVVIGVDWGQVTAIQDTATMIFTCDDPDEPTVTVQVVAIQGELPIQLRSFTGRLCSSDLVRLEWSTTSETNNYGFEVQRSSSPASGFTTIAGSFVAGHGTTLALHCYAYTDSTASGVAPYYRLKQIDLDGMLHYTDAIRPGGLTDVGNVPDPTMYALDQNFPNPFNPTTTVSFALPKPEHVTLKVFDLLGREVATLADEQLGAGYHRRMWNAGEMPSGVYFCRLHAGDFAQTRKLVLMK